MWKLVLLFAGVGIILALYLLWQQVYQPPFTPCNISSTVNCNAIITGSVSQTLGISTPLIGLVGYVAVLFAGIFRQKGLLLGAAIFGLLFCLWIAYQEFFQLRVICPVCILCQLDMIGVFLVALFLMRQQKKV